MFNDYVTSLVENSNKFVIFFKILEETIKASERILLFSQSLLTLDLIEDFLQQRSVPGTKFNIFRQINNIKLKPFFLEQCLETSGLTMSTISGWTDLLPLQKEID